MFSILLLTSAALVNAQLLGAIDLSTIAGITVANGVATVDTAATISTAGTIENTLKVTGDAVFTIAAEVTVQGEVVIEENTSVVVQSGNKLIADTVACGSASGKGALTIENGSALMINGNMNLDASTCTVTAGEGTVLFASEAEAEADAKSTIEAGTYAIAKLEAQGKAQVESKGDVVVEGAVTLRGNAQMKAEGQLKATGDIVMQGNAKLQSSGSKAVEAASVQMAGSTTYVARYKGAASASADAALKAAGNVKFDGELMIDATGELNTDDEFVIATYDSFEGKFKTVTSASASANAEGNASAGRKRAEDGDWTVEYGDKEAKAKYSGAPQAGSNTDSASALVLSAGALVATFAAFF